MTPVKTRWSLFDWPIQARWAVTLVFIVLVNLLLLAPARVFSGVHNLLAHQDKIAHVAIFLTLALLVRWSLPGESRRGWLQGAVLAALLVYAGSIEVCQPLLTRAGRVFEWLDMACNYAGVCSGWLLFGGLVFYPQPQSLPDKV